MPPLQPALTLYRLWYFRTNLHTLDLTPVPKLRGLDCECNCLPPSPARRSLRKARNSKKIAIKNSCLRNKIRHFSRYRHQKITKKLKKPVLRAVWNWVLRY
ncbi:MAG: hypothetical protein RLZZ612_146 [Pseudomonadota bacterium]|jgi:hypothetical protein